MKTLVERKLSIVPPLKKGVCESGRDLLLPGDVGDFFIIIFVHPCVLRVAE